jgi:hypothetical protein
LGTNKHIGKQISTLQKAADKETDIERRLDELIGLLTSADIDSAKVKVYQDKFNKAIEISSLRAFEQLDNEALSREDLLDRLGDLLKEHPVDSEQATMYVKKSTAKRIVLALLGLIMITLGFGMIAIPAPPYFELFTVLYFPNGHGVTIMDLISLVIILIGVYLLIMALIRHKRES